jgi:hypothetical protein
MCMERVKGRFRETYVSQSAKMDKKKFVGHSAILAML